MAFHRAREISYLHRLFINLTLSYHASIRTNFSFVLVFIRYKNNGFVLSFLGKDFVDVLSLDFDSKSKPTKNNCSVGNPVYVCDGEELNGSLI